MLELCLLECFFYVYKSALAIDYELNVTHRSEFAEILKEFLTLKDFICVCDWKWRRRSMYLDQVHLVLLVAEHVCICDFVLRLAVSKLFTYDSFFSLCPIWHRSPYLTLKFCSFSGCLQAGGGSHFISSSSAVKSTTVSTVHAGDIHLAQPNVSNSYNERDVPPWHRSQPLSALQNHEGPSELPGGEREKSSLGAGMPSPERVKQLNRDAMTSSDLQETEGHQKLRSVVAGRVIWCLDGMLWKWEFFMYFWCFYMTRCSNTDGMWNLYLVWFTWFSWIFLCRFETATAYKPWFKR